MRCPNCGNDIPGDLSTSPCPACLLRLCLDADFEDLPESTPAATPEARPTSTIPPSDRNIIAYFGDYELLHELARGAMGIVYCARQIKLDRIVALKRLNPSLLEGPDGEIMLRRFRDEPRRSGILHHPNIVEVYEVGECDGHPYFSMQFVQGRELAELVKDSPLPPTAAAEYALKITHAIAYAHSKGVLHRDLKPQNVLIDSAGEPRITDFGLARHLTHPSSVVTEPGRILGTPSYMPPEQAKGLNDSLGVECDVYSIGAILYHLLTSRPPFVAESTAATLHQVIYDDPAAPTLLNPAIPSDLETICLKCLEKDPARRYPTAHDLHRDLELFLQGRPILARPISMLGKLAKWRQRNPLGALLLLLLTSSLLAGIAGVASQWNRAENLVVNLRSRLARAYEGNASRLLDSGNAFEALLWSAAAQDLLDSESPEARINLHRFELVRSMSPQLAHILKHHGEVGSLQFHQARLELATISVDRSLRWWHPESESLSTSLAVHPARPTSLMHSRRGDLLATGCEDGVLRLWNTRSRLLENAFTISSTPIPSIAFGSNDTLVASAARGGEVMVHTVPDGQLVARWSRTNAAHFVAFNPAGNQLVHVGADGDAVLWTVGTPPGSSLVLRHPDQVYHAAFPASGRRLITSCADGMAYLWDLSSGAKLATFGNHSKPVLRALFLPDERRVAVASSDGTARIWNLDSGSPASLEIRHDQAIRDLVLSPDGRWLATASLDGTARLWSTRSGEPLTPPLPHAALVTQVAFSPAGNLLATSSTDHTVRVWNLHAQQPRPVLLTGTSVLSHAIISRDGRLIAGSDQAGQITLWEPATGRVLFSRSPERFTTTDLAFDSSGDLIAASSREGGIHVWKTQTGERLPDPPRQAAPVTAIDFHPAASLLATAGGDSSARVWNLETGQLHVRPFFHSNSVLDVVFSPDGSRIATASGDDTARVWHLESATSSPPLKHDDRVLHARFTPDGTRIATASTDNSARVWNPDSGLPLGPPLRHGAWLGDSKWVLDAIPSPDGHWLATLCFDGSVRIWDLKNPRLAAVMTGHDEAVSGGVFSPDSRLLASWDAAGTVRIWDVLTGYAMTSRLNLQGSILAGTFLSTPLRLLLVSRERLAFHWDLSEHRLADSSPAAFARIHAARELVSEADVITPHPLARQQIASMSDRVPGAYQPNPGSLQAWHQRQAALSAAEGATEAAGFHSRVSEIAPDPPSRPTASPSEPPVLSKEHESGRP